MAINQKTWANANHISVAELQNLQDNSVNKTDDIHEQYNQPLVDARCNFVQGGISESFFASSPDATIPSSATDNARFALTVGSYPMNIPLLWLSFTVGQTNDIDIDFDYITGDASATNNSLRYRIYRQVNAGLSVLEHSSTEVSNTGSFARISQVNHTIASLNAGSTDSLLIYVVGKIGSSSLSYTAGAKGLKVVLNF